MDCEALGIKDVETLINKKEGELYPLLAQMEQLRFKFTGAVVKFASAWYEETAKNYIGKHSEITLQMDKEKLTEMKSKVKGLINNAENLVEVALAEPHVWWHKAPRKNEYYGKYETLVDKFPQVLDAPVRRALGELGSILEQFGYGVTTTGAFRNPSPEYWYVQEAGYGSPFHPYFPHKLMWSQEMRNAIERYSSLFQEALMLFSEITKLKEEKKKQQAKALWDST